MVKLWKNFSFTPKLHSLKSMITGYWETWQNQSPLMSKKKLKEQIHSFTHNTADEDHHPPVMLHLFRSKLFLGKYFKYFIMFFLL